MTTEQTMLSTSARAGLSALLCGLMLLSGCSQGPQLVAPETLTAPYDASRGEVLWAVVPLRNESGTSVVDIAAVSDHVVGALSQVRGVRTLPLNRTIGAMRSLGMTSLTSPEEARRLAAEMGVDGLVLGSITAWDPYDPPKLGLALALYARPGAMQSRGAVDIDTRDLQQLSTDYDPFPRSTFGGAPASTVHLFLDGKNHQVLMDVRRYAAGRHDETAALGWKRYLTSMDLFTEFAAWQAAGRLLDQEWVRLARTAGAGDGEK